MTDENLARIEKALEETRENGMRLDHGQLLDIAEEFLSEIRRLRELDAHATDYKFGHHIASSGIKAPTEWYVWDDTSDVPLTGPMNRADAIALAKRMAGR